MVGDRPEMVNEATAKQVSDAQEAFDRASKVEEDKARLRGMRFPKLDFPTFVLSLHHSAMVNLAEDAGASLPMAKHMIDTIEMLREKTRGNLEPEEEKLLQMLLFELQMKYVEKQKVSK
ncbi:MAG: DUF1844 domain-containing protein [Myxococcales bacterium]|nr:DUF1844 domain-containing protein [Myxococcales bacterium]MCB9643651.1 DUF1844 domain-containing protein [Myxococcales bacterium]